MRTRDLLVCAGLLGTFTLAACGGAAPVAMEGTAEDEAAIRALPGAYTTAFNANDAAGLAALMAPDYEAVAADGTHVMGPADVQAGEQAAMDERAAAGVTVTLSATPEFVQWVDANHAVMGGTFGVTGVPEGSPTSGSWLVTVERSDDGQWLMTSSLAADFIEPPAMPEEDAEGM